MAAWQVDQLGVGSFLRRAVAAGLAPGFVALAARDGESGPVWCAGSTGIGGGPASPDLAYDLASLTKPLATVTLLLLARRDGLALETRLGEVIPELAGSAWDGVTLLECATHTAGFPAWEPLYARRAAGEQDYVGALRGLAPVAAPGTGVVYSCPGFIALGLALERAGGAGLAVMFDELIAEPLGLSGELRFAPPAGSDVAAGEREWFVERALLAERGIAGEPPLGPPGVAPCDDGNARGAGGAAGNAGLFGTAAAVARLAAEYLPGGGTLLDADEAAIAVRDHTPGLEQARGLGWQLASTAGCSAGPALPPDAFGHTGFTGTSVWVNAHARGVHVLLGNRLHPGGRAPDLHPLRRRFHRLASAALERVGGEDGDT